LHGRSSLEINEIRDIPFAGGLTYGFLSAELDWSVGWCALGDWSFFRRAVLRAEKAPAYRMAFANQRTYQVWANQMYQRKSAWGNLARREFDEREMESYPQ
jgi:hypothetical protein